MADPTTELAREFLEFNEYMVKKETKFYKNKKLKGNPGDIDIIAVSSKDTKFGDFILNKQIVAEVKNWKVDKKSIIREIYEDKFKHIDNYKISWKQLKKYFPYQKFDRVLFCFATTEEIFNYAWEKYGIKIITAGFMIKQLANQYKEYGRLTYYPEAYNLNLIRTIMTYLFDSHKYKDKLLIEDLVWIDPYEEPKYRNQFNKLNAKFMADFVIYDNDVLIDMIKEDPRWFFDEVVKVLKKKDKKYLRKKIKKI